MFFVIYRIMWNNSKHRLFTEIGGNMAETDAQKMDNAANEASEELDKILEQHPDGAQAVKEWVKKWFLKAGYKRLGKILADRWE